MSNKPKFESNNFQCPLCGVVAQQKWINDNLLKLIIWKIYSHMYYEYRTGISGYLQDAIKDFLDYVEKEYPENIKLLFPKSLSIATCEVCGKYSLWVDQDMVHPKVLAIEKPNSDMNEEIQSLYNEASRILIDSPKGSTALLRLALQKLLKQIGKEGKNINSDIKELVESGLSTKIQKSLDLLRVVGNNAVHPGQINIEDNSEVALKLFKVLNYIADEMISKPKEIDNLYNDIIPEDTKDIINKRDKLTR